MYLTLKGCTGYLGRPFLHQEHRGVHEEQGRGFSCREGCFSRLFPVADSAKQEARLPTDLVPRACVRHSLLPCEQGKRKKTCPRPDRNLGHDRGTDRNRRASDYPQEDQRDRQTRSTTFSVSPVPCSLPRTVCSRRAILRSQYSWLIRPNVPRKPPHRTACARLDLERKAACGWGEDSQRRSRHQSEDLGEHPGLPWPSPAPTLRRCKNRCPSPRRPVAYRLPPVPDRSCRQ